MSEMNDPPSPHQETPRESPHLEGCQEYQPQPVEGANLDEFVPGSMSRHSSSEEQGQPGEGGKHPEHSMTSEPGESVSEVEVPRRRRVRLPLILFAVTCVSTFWVGANHWLPIPIAANADTPLLPLVRRAVLVHWPDGLIYTGCLLGILLAHEMGHFLTTLRYGVPASLPYFIPFPISPIGTMGAVIGMDGLRANRRELFDIGLAGPVAGLVVAVPVMWIGITQLDLTRMGYGPFALDLPLITRIALSYLQPAGYESGKLIYYSQLNPYFMAGWVGFLITGLNMLPVSQLDGGHVMYTLFGKKAHWVARGLVLLAIFMVLGFQQWRWSLMIMLVLLIGTDHPPTSNDAMPLGRGRTLIGLFAILIPLFCFAPRLIIVPN